MSTILQNPIRLSRVMTTNPAHARAIEDPTRAKIIQILYGKTLNAEQITARLAKAGSKKALTTVRHHLEVLKGSGLIEIARIEEARGAMTKYYGTSIKLFGYSAPADFDTKYSAAIKNASKRLQDVLDDLAPKAAPKEGPKGDPAYAQFVQVEILNRAVAQIIARADKTRGTKKAAKK